MSAHFALLDDGALRNEWYNGQFVEVRRHEPSSVIDLGFSLRLADANDVSELGPG
jgi:hypothetical protein